MVNDNLYLKLKYNLNVVYMNNSNSEIVIRCPYCGDSINSATHAHFYIESTEPYRYHCKRCSSSGIFTAKTMGDLNFYDQDVFKDLILRDMNMKTSNVHNFKFGHTDSKNKIKIPYQNFDKWRFKLKYLENRLNVNLTPESMIDYKMVLDFKSFFNENRIYDNHESFNNLNYSMVKKFEHYDENSIGFLSEDRTHIVFRSINGTFYNGKRYDNFNMFPDRLDASKRYVVKGSMDLMSTDVFNVNVTEGIIDLISVRENGLKENNTNPLYMAINGKDYLHNIKTVIYKGLLNNQINIFSDSEIALRKYKYLKKGLLSPNKLNIYYNSAGEDFGVKNIILDKHIF